jgi:hypothetical protein
LNHDAIEPSSGLGYSGKSSMVIFDILNVKRILWSILYTIFYYNNNNNNNNNATQLFIIVKNL